MNIEKIDNSLNKIMIKNFVYIPGGTFTMGCTFGKIFGEENELMPETYLVTLSPFYIGKYLVTFAEYDQYCKSKRKEYPKDEDWGREQRPVINVTWFDVVRYCNWLSKKNGLEKVYTIEKETKCENNGKGFDVIKCNVEIDIKKNGFRLPTEAEWEFVASNSFKGSLSNGIKTKYPCGNEKPDSLKANCREISDKDFGKYFNKTTPVGNYLDNNGIYDMAGNVWEWCNNWKGNYNTNELKNPIGPANGYVRVIRGGSWKHVNIFTNSEYSNGEYPFWYCNFIGFRICKSDV